MKVLFIKSNIHHKNLHFILNCKEIFFTVINCVGDIYNVDLNEFDAVISPCDAIDILKYPNVKFIFGPQFSVFPDERLNMIKGPKTAYNLLSDWVINIWKSYPICDDLKLVTLPFGVDTDKFKNIKAIEERTQIMVYFKHRNPLDLSFIENFLKSKHLNYAVFSYDARYNENDYIEYLQNSKYCIWIDAHESQGFALQEALSCDVPLLVWNVKYMSQEYCSNYQNLEATTTSYWDKKCGELFYDATEFEDTYVRFVKNINNYKPRNFITENLSINACENKLINFINNM